MQKIVNEYPEVITRATRLETNLTEHELKVIRRLPARGDSDQVNQLDINVDVSNAINAGFYEKEDDEDIQNLIKKYGKENILDFCKKTMVVESALLTGFEFLCDGHITLDEDAIPSSVPRTRGALIKYAEGLKIHPDSGEYRFDNIDVDQDTVQTDWSLQVYCIFKCQPQAMKKVA